MDSVDYIEDLVEVLLTYVPSAKLQVNKMYTQKYIYLGKYSLLTKPK